MLLVPSLSWGLTFKDGKHKIEWYWIDLGDDGEIIRNYKLGFDEVLVKNGNL